MIKKLIMSEMNCFYFIDFGFPFVFIKRKKKGWFLVFCRIFFETGFIFSKGVA